MNAKERTIKLKAGETVTDPLRREYLVPGMAYEDGTREAFSVSVRGLPSYEALCRRARADPENDLHYAMVIWHYLLNQYTDYRGLESHFRDWFESVPYCVPCTALRAADEPHGLDLDPECSTCFANWEARGVAAGKWLRAAELGIARWAAQQWPELDIENATSGGSLHEPGFSAADLAAAPLEVYDE